MKAQTFSLLSTSITNKHLPFRQGLRIYCEMPPSGSANCPEETKTATIHPKAEPWNEFCQSIRAESSARGGLGAEGYRTLPSANYYDYVTLAE